MCTFKRNAYAGAAGPNRMANVSSGPLGVAIHDTALFRCTPTSIQAVSVDNGSVLSIHDVPRAYGAPLAITVSGSTAAAITATLAVAVYTIAKRGAQLKEISSGQLAPDNIGADSLSAVHPV